MYAFYDSNIQSNGYVINSITVSSPPVTSGTFTLASNLIIATNVGQTYGGSGGTSLLINQAPPAAITVGSLVTVSFGGSTNVIQISSIAGSGPTNFVYTLYSGSGGVAASSGTTINWSV